MVQSVITNEIMKKALRYSGKVGVLASEEEDVPMSVAGNNDKYKKGARSFRSQFNSDVLIEETGGKYVAVFDPLDGSSNVDAGIPTGTIFGIFENDPSNLVGTPLSLLHCTETPHYVVRPCIIWLPLHCTLFISFFFLSLDR
jgi:fructose-1,6-bisphosphatase I